MNFLTFIFIVIICIGFLFVVIKSFTYFLRYAQQKMCVLYTQKMEISKKKIETKSELVNSFKDETNDDVMDIPTYIRTGNKLIW